jgi:1-deoxy-D-xylulose-5-phosphate synthase
MRFAKPLDKTLLETVAKSHDWIVTFEENAVTGGAGSEVERALQTLNLHRPCLRIGLPDAFIEHGDTTNLYKSAGLDIESLRNRIQQFVEQTQN